MSSSDPTAKSYHGGYPVVGNPYGAGANSTRPQNYQQANSQGTIVTSGNNNTVVSSNVGAMSGQPLNTIAPGMLTGAYASTISASGWPMMGTTIGGQPSDALHWDRTNDGAIPMFQEKENGILVKARFEPDANMSAIEGLRIQLLVSSLMHGENAVISKPITYLRSYGLERHFRFTT